MKLMPYPTREENKAKWYSKQDEAKFKRRRWHDVAKYSAMLLQGNIEDELTQKEKLIKCIGLENLLSYDTAQKAQEVASARESHSNVVLNVQELQRTLDIYCPVDISRMSMASSRSARQRAYKIASIHELL
jgi:hypothetical protein